MAWYVVFRGRKTGVFQTWPQCNAQVSGFSHCSFQSYGTKEQAEQAFEEFKKYVHETYFDNTTFSKPLTAVPGKYEWKNVAIVALLVLVTALWVRLCSLICNWAALADDDINVHVGWAAGLCSCLVICYLCTLSMFVGKWACFYQSDVVGPPFRRQLWLLNSNIIMSEAFS